MEGVRWKREGNVQQVKERKGKKREGKAREGMEGERMEKGR